MATIGSKPSIAAANHDARSLAEPSEARNTKLGERTPERKMSITRTMTIVAAVTLGWLGGMAAMSWTKAAGPRMAELTQAQLDDQQRPIADRILKFSRIGISGPYHIWLRSPQAAKPIIDLMDYVRFQSSVPVRLREFSIMIQGRLWRSQVEWATHYQPAINAGVSAETLAALKANQRPTTMKPDEAAVYDFCMELFTKHAVSDETYSRLHQVLNDQQIVDLTVLQGLYVTAAATMAMADQGLPPNWDVAFKSGEP
jgi:4-carboxymuconolactone decarboxylase